MMLSHEKLVWIRLGLLTCLIFTCSEAFAVERLVVEVQEIGGFRRHEPVSAQFKLPKPVPRGTPFRLLINGAPASAQFRPATDGEQTAQWWVDFSTILGPYEQHSYVIEYGQDVRPPAEPAAGHVLRQTTTSFVIENAPYISWTVPRDLHGLLSSVNFPPSEHLRPQSPGIVLQDRSGSRHALGGANVKARIVRSGTRAVALQFTETMTDGPLSGVKWVTDLIFPSPVSWADVNCKVDDPEDKVAAIGIELNVALDAPKPDSPTLVDLGAWTQVYTSLTRDDIVEMLAESGSVTAISDPHAKNSTGVHGAGGRCAILRGQPKQLLPMAANYADGENTGTVRQLTAAPEGWLHVMDRKRCLALAVDQFAQNHRERLTVSADGGVRIGREFADSAGKPARDKTLRCWLHFVHYPPQYSAGTSPRMMQTRPIVRINPR